MNQEKFMKTAAQNAAVPNLSSIASTDTISDAYSPYEDTDIDGGPALTNRQLNERLALIADRNDRMELKQIGTSAGRNDPIMEAKIGDGDTSIHIINQIHGDEPFGTEALMSILRRLVDGNSRLVDLILDNLELTIIPRLNPDGAMYTEDRNDDGTDQVIQSRINSQPWRESFSEYRPYYHTEELPGDERGGYDPNRDFNIYPDFVSGLDDNPGQWEESGVLTMEKEGYELPLSGVKLTPQVRACVDSFLKADPDYAKTIHSQGLPLDPDTGDVTILSVMAPLSPDYAEEAPFGDPEEDPIAEFTNPFLDKETVDRAIRLNEVAAQGLEGMAGPWDTFTTGTRFGYTSLWGSYLDTLCPQTDAAGMLYELPGQTNMSDVGERAYYMKVEATRIALLESFVAIAQDPTLEDTGIDISEYFDRPLASGSWDPDADVDSDLLEAHEHERHGHCCRPRTLPSERDGPPEVYGLD